MTSDEFRQLALGLPSTEESAHMNHPDFRVKGKIFATLDGEEKRAMVKLTPETQATFMQLAPGSIEPASGAWGRNGATMLTLADVSVDLAQQALILAWRNTAPAKLVSLVPDVEPRSKGKTQ